MAIFMVAIAHYVQWQWGNIIVLNIPFVYGVTLFFVLSGFLITRILLLQKGKPLGNSLKVFYGRRALRIFPLYYLVLLVVFLLGYQDQQDLLPFLLTYTINIYHSLNLGINLGDFSHLWSLAVEEQFYLVWPLLVLVVPKRSFMKVACGLVLLSLVYKVYVLVSLGNWKEADNGFISNFYSLGIGGVLGYWSLYNSVFYKKIGTNMVLGLFTILAIFTIGYRVYVPDDEFFKIVSMQLVWVLFFSSFIVKASLNEGGVFKFVFENPVISYLGKISYGIYIIHLFIPTLFYYLSPTSIFIQNKYIGFIGFFAISIVLASLSWFLVEKPFLRFKKRWTY